MKEDIAKFLEATRKVHEYTSSLGYGKGRKGGSLTMTCPICNGILHVSVATINGHHHGVCETKDCLRWME